MVKEPVEAIKRDLAIDFLIDVQSSRDRLVVGRVQTERPTVRDQVSNYRFKFRFHHRLHIRTHLKKVLKISSREDKHLARAVYPVEVVSFAWLRYLGPVLKVGELFLGALGKQVSREAEGKLPTAVEILDNCIVIGIILEA